MLHSVNPIPGQALYVLVLSTEAIDCSQYSAAHNVWFVLYTVSILHITIIQGSVAYRHGEMLCGVATAPI